MMRTLYKPFPQNDWVDVFQCKSVEVSVYVSFSNSGTVWFLWPYRLAADAPP